MRGGEQKTTFTTARSATSITAGWVDSVCRCHEDSVELGREEAAVGGERERETNRAEQGHWRGVKRLTVCYHGNATPLRQEESLNPARYGPCRLSLSVHPINGALSCPRERAKGEERRRGGVPLLARRRGRRAMRGWGWWRPDYATNSVFTPKCFHRALPIYRVAA